MNYKIIDIDDKDFERSVTTGEDVLPKRGDLLRIDISKDDEDDQNDEEDELFIVLAVEHFLCRDPDRVCSSALQRVEIRVYGKRLEQEEYELLRDGERPADTFNYMLEEQGTNHWLPVKGAQTVPRVGDSLFVTVGKEPTTKFEVVEVCCNIEGAHPQAEVKSHDLVVRVKEAKAR